MRFFFFRTKEKSAEKEKRIEARSPELFYLI